MTYRFKECVNAINEPCPKYRNEVFDATTENNFQVSGSFQKLKCLFRKTNTGQLALSYISLIF